MKSSIPKNQPNIFIKIAGLVLMILGLIIIINPEPLNLKLGFSSIIIGIFMIVIISEESENKKTDYCYKGNAKIIIRILEDLEINGNAIFIPKSNQITEEKILIPPNKEGTIKIPEIKNNDLFLKGNNNENLGIVLPPSGLELLNNIEKEVKFENTEIGNIEEKLQIFVSYFFSYFATF